MGRFQRVRMEGDLALFRWSGKAQSSPVFGLRKDEARAQPSMPTLKEFWEKDTASAIVITASEPPGDLSAWASYIGYSPQSEDNIVAWLEAPSPASEPDADFRSLRVNRRTCQLNIQSGFNLGVLQITVEGNRAGRPAVASWDYGAAALSLTDASLHAVRLDDRQLEATISPSASIAMCLDGNQAGALIFRLADQDAYLLFGLLGDSPPPGQAPPKRAMPEIRYFYPGGKLSFPMAEPISAGKSLTAVVSLNPSLPFSASDTYFKPDLSRQAMLDLFTCTSLTQTNGHRATLVPADDFGFHLAAAPNCYNNRWRHFYPAPFGPMRVTTSGEIKLMCGLSGYEYLQLGEGAVVALVPNQSAYAVHFDPPAARARGDPHEGGRAVDTLLSGLGQTSWLSIRTPSGYYSQSDVEPFFAARVMQNRKTKTYPSAVSSYLSDPSNVAGATNPAFPFAPYSAVYDESDSNAHVAPDVFAAYEAQVLVQHRYQVLVPENAVPVFQDHKGVPLFGGAAVTPTGFIARLARGPKAGASLDKDLGRNGKIAMPAAGAWRSLGLAGHTENVGGPKQDRRLASREVGDTVPVIPDLSEALLRPGAFLVANNWDALGDILPQLAADGFTFRLRPAPKTDADHPIAVFKFQTTTSLEDLIKTPSFWCNPADWVVGGPDGIQKAQETVQKAIGVANAARWESADPYEYFRSTIARDPKWTGVVILNVPIAACDVMPDSQVLFAGIDGRLYAHHVGFQQNQPTFPAGGNSALKLFGVIHYRSTHLPAANPAPPAAGWDKFAFTVLDWAVGIENSLVNHFDALVAITIPELFDRQVSFTDPELAALAEDIAGIELRANTLVMRGVYQRQGQAGSAGALAFQRKDPLKIPIFREGDLKRVIDHVQITSAVLTPGVTTVAPAKSPASPAACSDQNREVQARLSLRGQICFSPNPFGVTIRRTCSASANATNPTHPAAW